MSYFLPHLPTGWHVDQAILSEEDRVVILRFGKDTDPVCMEMDETLYKISTAVQNFAVIYWSTLRRCRTLTRCTSCTMLARPCFSTATSTS